MRDALGEDLSGFPGAVVVPLGEVDHCLLGAPQVERRALALHRLLNGAHVSVGVVVQQLQEEREVDRIALVGRGGEQQVVVRGVAQQLAQPVAQALVRFVAGRHAVSLVNDDEIPLDLAQPGQDLVALSQVERGNDLLLLYPLVDTELIAQVAALKHQELLVELLLELPLPLESEVGRRDDQDALGQAA